MTTAATQHWDKTIVVERIGGVPYKMYAERPRRIEHILDFAGCWGTRPYVVQGDRTLGFDALVPAIHAKAQRLGEFGVTAGDRVVILGWNSPDWIVNFWACASVGAVPVLGNAWWSADDIAYALDLLRPALTLADVRCAEHIPPRWKLGSWEAHSELDIFTAEHALATSAVQIPEMRFTHSGKDLYRPAKVPDTAGGGSGKAGASWCDENASAAIIFTSGTEGRAKAVVLSHRALIATQQMLLHVTRRLPYRPDGSASEVTLHTGPLFHIGGIGALIRGVLLGNTLVFPRGRFEPGEALELIERYRISRWNAVPTMASRLVEHGDVATRDLASLKTLTLGGAPVHAELLSRIRGALAGLQARIATGYGLSENAGQATAAGGADVLEHPGSSGRPLPLAEIRIHQRSGQADGKVPDGEVQVRSPTQMSGYFGIDTSPIDAEGWLSTGDLGRIDDAGRLWITGRAKDLIIRGGENIAPASVERALMLLPGISEAAVLGMPHADLGEEVIAVVVVTGEQTAEELRAQLQGRLPSFALPSRWRLEREPLPVNQTGKIDKVALRTRLLGSE